MKSPNYLVFQQENPKEWKKLLDDIFPQGLPLRAVWQGATEIQSVLNRLGAAQDVHYTFLPSGGGLDLHGARGNGDTGLTELDLGSGMWLCQPAALSFESFGDEATYFWCYFRLELRPLSVRPESPTNRQGY